MVQANAYTTIKTPWKVTDRAALAETLSLLVETLRKTALLLQPFIPDSASLLLDRLGIDSSERTLHHAKLDERKIGMSRFVRSMQANQSRPPIFNALARKAT